MFKMCINGMTQCVELDWLPPVFVLNIVIMEVIQGKHNISIKMSCYVYLIKIYL